VQPRCKYWTYVCGRDGLGHIPRIRRQ